jgi:response regulator of citrate/malate metabolism
MNAEQEQVLKTLGSLFERKNKTGAKYVYTLDALAKVTQTSRPTVRKYLKIYSKKTGNKIVKATVRKGSRGPEAITYGHAA